MTAPAPTLRLVYSGPAEVVEDVKAVTGTAMDVQWVPPEPGAVAVALAGAAAFLDASMKVAIGADMIQASPHLLVIATATTGADHIDEAALARAGIPLYTLRGQTELLRDLTPAAEHSWLLVMACARSLPAAHAHVLGGGWNRVDFPGVMLRGKTLGIIGCGRIGTWMSRYAEAFGMRCLGHDPLLTAWPPTITPAPLERLLAAADFVTLHVPFTRDNAGMIDRACFQRMKRGAVFVNTSRGDLVDERALLEALESGRLAAAGLDVLTGEPEIADHPLRQYALTHTNLILTPHIGGFSPDAVRIVVRFAAERIVRHLGVATS